jgi:hypothetical protein
MLWRDPGATAILVDLPNSDKSNHPLAGHCAPTKLGLFRNSRSRRVASRCLVSCATDEPVVRHSRWHGVRRAARPQGNRNRCWSSLARGWSKGAARGQGMGGESSDAWRGVLDDLISREPPRPSESLTPTRRCVSETTFAGQNPAGICRHQSNLCTINVPLHDKHVFDTHI